MRVYPLPGFNSTLVQLKGDIVRRIAEKLQAFQFYLSSIKSFMDTEKDCRFISFNSTLVQLKGQVELDAVKPEKCFNSTLVQLKAIYVLYSSAAICCFNSTLVQLKVGLGCSGTPFR